MALRGSLHSHLREHEQNALERSLRSPRRPPGRRPADFNSTPGLRSRSRSRVEVCRSHVGAAQVPSKWRRCVGPAALQVSRGPRRPPGRGYWGACERHEGFRKLRRLPFEARRYRSSHLSTCGLAAVVDYERTLFERPHLCSLRCERSEPRRAPQPVSPGPSWQ